MGKALRCLLGWHRWVKQHLEGEVYLQCADCGKVIHGPGPIPDLGGGAG